VTSRGVQTEFLKVGGTPQERYESLRSRWLTADSPGVLGMVRLPWGRRLLYFGVLGVLDTDPTGIGWFEVIEPVTPSVATEPAPGPRCMRVMLPTVDGESRLRNAYRSILFMREPLQHAAGE